MWIRIPHARNLEIIADLCCRLSKAGQESELTEIFTGDVVRFRITLLKNRAGHSRQLLRHCDSCCLLPCCYIKYKLWQLLLNIYSFFFECHRGGETLTFASKLSRALLCKKHAKKITAIIWFYRR